MPTHPILSICLCPPPLRAKKPFNRLEGSIDTPLPHAVERPPAHAPMLYTPTCSTTTPNVPTPGKPPPPPRKFPPQVQRNQKRPHHPKPRSRNSGEESEVVI